MNNKGLLARNWIVLVVMIGMLVAASSYWISAWQDKYSPIEPANLSTSYNAIAQVTADTDVLESKLQSETKATGIGFLDFIAQGGYNVLLAVLAVPNILKGFVVDVGGELGIPSVYVNGFVVLISVGAIFGIIGAIFRRKT